MAAWAAIDICQEKGNKLNIEKNQSHLFYNCKKMWLYISFFYLFQSVFYKYTHTCAHTHTMLWQFPCNQLTNPVGQKIPFDQKALKE